MNKVWYYFEKQHAIIYLPSQRVEVLLKYILPALKSTRGYFSKTVAFSIPSDINLGSTVCTVYICFI